MKFFLLIFSFILSGFNAYSQVENIHESPYSVVYNHLFYLQDDTYRPSMSARSFSSQLDTLASRRYAIRLKQIYDGLGLYVRVEDIPTASNYKDSTNNKSIYTLFPGELPAVYVEKRGNSWYYSAETVNTIPTLHKNVYPFGSDLLVNLFPKTGGTKILGLYPWQYGGILLLIAAGILFFFVVNWITKTILLRLRVVQLSFWEERKKTIKGIHRATTYWLLIQFVFYLLPVLQLPIQTSKVLILFLKILSSLVVLLLFFRLFDLIRTYLRKAALKTESKMDEQLLPLVNKLGQFVMLSIWLVYLLTIFKVNITAMVAGLSIGGLAIALAAQDTLKNLFGSVTIFLDKPFQIGDWIKTSDAEGTVEEVGFRSTRIRSFANSLIYVPNSKLSDSTIDNLGLRKLRRYSTRIGITYNTPPDKVQAFVDGLRNVVRKNEHVFQDNFEIHFNDLGPSALEILFYIFFQVPDWSTELMARHNLLLEILKLAQEQGISFAFPSQSIYIEKNA